MSSKKLISIQIISDIQCPWCIVGFARLKEAMELSKDQFDFQVYFSPYILNSKIEDNGQSFTEYFAQKGMSVDIQKYQQMIQTLQQAGQQCKYPVTFQNPSQDHRLYNTINGHRLAEWCLQKFGKDKQVELYEHLIRKYFEERKNIHNPEVLAEYAQQIGYDKEEIISFLKNNDNEPSRSTILKKDNSVKNSQVNGVPFFIFNEKYSFSGAQDPKAFVQVFNQLNQ